MYTNFCAYRMKDSKFYRKIQISFFTRNRQTPTVSHPLDKPEVLGQTYRTRSMKIILSKLRTLRYFEGRYDATFERVNQAIHFAFALPSLVQEPYLIVSAVFWQQKTWKTASRLPKCVLHVLLALRNDGFPDC